ncbi:N-acyl-D-amino-acid deacylase family protein [Plantibacter sp. Mn2098]|uniref:N-acyl-D-amino-acid deacylase family protein n=1 Tax=Plantibacter sp. Mn2098 TaxID=3395266 RepID=UPI003BE7E07E
MTTPPVLIRDARIIDGTGAPSIVGDVLLDGGRIVAMGGRIDVPTDVAADARVIEAAGLAIAPGFIDMHAHSDLAVLRDSDHLAKVSQGITTEVLGQDGLSYAPTTDETMAIIRRQITGWNGSPDDVDFLWRSIGEYLDLVDRGAAVNVAYLVPQGSVRMAVVGTEDRRATPEEIERMRTLVADGMREGAFGMSSGLTYVPGMFADTAELVALCETVAEHGGFFAPHQRSYGRGALDAYAEMVEVSRLSGAALHLTHATMNFGENAGRAAELVRLIDDAAADGIDITFDTYPYLPGSTTLSALLPSWVATGGPDATLERLRDPGVQARVRHELEVTGTDGCHGVVADWATIEISGVQNPALAGIVGRTVAESAALVELVQGVAVAGAGPIGAAESTGAAESAGAAGAADSVGASAPAVIPASILADWPVGDPTGVFFAILQQDRLATGILQHVGDEANVRTMMNHPRHTGGSDGILVGAKPHPRSWGTFPRFLGHYVRDEGVLGLEDAVAHFTSRPAARLGLVDRGVLRVGAVADVVLFDPSTVADRATFADPRQQSAGIPWVFVAGVPVIENGIRTDALPGRALRHRPAS